MLFYTRHLGDYARDTGHLTTYEHGVYTLLLDRFYATEKPFGEREAMQLCRPANGRERDRIRRILNDFFILTASGYVNARAMKEMEKVHEKQAKAKQSAQTRWMRTHSERNANGMLTNIQYPITNKPSALAGYPDTTKSPDVKGGTPRISADAALRVVGLAKREER